MPYTHVQRPPRVIEALEQFTEISDHLQFAETMIERRDIPNSVRKDLRQQLGHIRKRESDNQLYLAIIGEFSSGKSTLINALLRDELLMTSARITTAVATHLQFGQKIGVEVQFRENGANRSQESMQGKERDRQFLLPGSSGLPPMNTRQFIQQITTDEAIAQNVRSVTITHPSPFLSHHIEIIDTPGTNATNPDHIAITTGVLEHEADVALIVIPATMPFSQSLAAFLDQTVRMYLHRCLFVITRMDQIRPREQDALLTDLQSRIAQHFQIPPPKLYPCSAQVFLDSLDSETEVPKTLVPQTLRQWEQEFTNLEKTILERLQRERSVAIAENLLRLLSRIFDQLDTQMRSQWQQYEQDQAILAREVIPDLSAFATEQHCVCQRTIEDATLAVQLEMESYLHRYRTTTLEEIQDTILKADNWEQLHKAVQTDAEAILNQKNSELQEAMATIVQQLTQAGESAGQKFNQRFTQAYQKLETLGCHFDIPVTSVQTSPHWRTDHVFASMQAQHQSLDNKDGRLAVGGAAAGAMIGTGILPGIGTVIGALVGLASSGFFSPSFEQRQQKLWEKLRPEIEAYFTNLQGQLQSMINQYAQQARHQLNQHIDSYIAHYQETIDQILEQQHHKLSLLMSLQETTHGDLQEINHRRQTFVTQQHRLATSTVHS